MFNIDGNKRKLKQNTIQSHSSRHEQISNFIYKKFKKCEKKGDSIITCVQYYNDDLHIIVIKCLTFLDTLV